MLMQIKVGSRVKTNLRHVAWVTARVVSVSTGERPNVR